MSKRPRELISFNLTIAEVLILSAANDRNGTYGYALGEILGEEKVGNGSIYRKLGHLTARGLLAQEPENPDVAGVHPGKPREMHKTTDLGAELLTGALRHLIDQEVVVVSISTANEQS